MIGSSRRPYYLVPSKEGVRAYALLREAIRESGRVGIAKFIMREAQHLAAVEVIDHAIVLSIMRFADELVDAGTLGLPGDLEIRKSELDMAKALVNSLAAEWDPSKYTDQYRENLLRIIKAKMKGKKVALKSRRRAAPGRSHRPHGAAPPQSRATRRGGSRAGSQNGRRSRPHERAEANGQAQEKSRGVDPADFSYPIDRRASTMSPC